MNNRGKFLALVSNEKTSALDDIDYFLKNRKWLRESGRIAIKVLLALEKQNKTQKDLAKLLKVTPQQVNKLVKGNENLTLETIVKLQEALQIPLLATAMEEQFKNKAGSLYVENTFPYTNEWAESNSIAFYELKAS